MIPNSTYIDWLDREIEKYEIQEKTDLPDNMRSYIRGRLKQLEESREKFLSLYPSQEVDNDEARQFTDGLD